MHLSRFQTLVDHLSRHDGISGSLSDLKVYLKIDDGWQEHGSYNTVQPGLDGVLSTVLSDGQHWRGTNSLTSYFPLQQFSAVVAGDTSSPSRASTRDTIERLINECIRHATHEFDANHDELTGLLNARALESAADRLFSSKSAESGLSKSLDQSAPTASFALIAFDIDHFKQINDSYGHDYGDLVLRCFAQRIDSHLRTLSSQRPIESYLARSGGEEFSLLLRCDTSHSSVIELAESLRESIANDLLPSDKEWQALESRSLTGPLSLPHASERRVTTSVGVSSLTSPSAIDVQSRVWPTMRRQADSALYKAKAGGRNAVRYFPDIRSRFGTILQHHDETDVVVIDLGSQVDVAAGHEFMVYHPSFTGATPFIWSDGRSQKRLGYYPRVDCGSIVVFDSQNEIAFCSVRERKGLNRFPVGSLLEYIPSGSIAHLLRGHSATSNISGASLSTRDELVSALTAGAPNISIQLVAVFRIANFESLEKKLGTAAVNQGLAILYHAIRNHSQDKVGSVVAQIDRNTLAVMSRMPTTEQQAFLQSIRDEAILKSNSTLELVVGAFNETHFNNDNPYKSVCELKEQLTYATYTATIAKPSNIVFFDSSTAASVVAQSRLQGNQKEAIADFDKLKQLGIVSPTLNNQRALSEFNLAQPDYDLAIGLLNEAILLDPTDRYFYANRGFAEFCKKDFEAAWASFQAMKAAESQTRVLTQYQALEAMAAFELSKAASPSIDNETLLNAFRPLSDTKGILMRPFSLNEFLSTRKAVLGE